jgi:hypothetical protein
MRRTTVWRETRAYLKAGSFVVAAAAALFAAADGHHPKLLDLSSNLRPGDDRFVRGARSA